MDLKSYIRKHGRQTLAKALDTAPAYISQLAYGQRRVTAEMAISIERATHGIVSRGHLRPDLFEEASA